MVDRVISLPGKLSFFLFGARQTGKSTLVHQRYAKDVWTIDLLETDTFLTYSKEPALLRHQVRQKITEGIRTVFIDEIQRVPALLNEIQGLIKNVQFILTGSSARKLKRGGANLLAGRAVERHLFPLVYTEMPSPFRLEEVLHFGTLPALLNHSRDEKIDILSAYTHTYLKEEIQSEGLARNLGAFSRFLDIAAASNGELLNYTAIARECQLPVRTVQSYYEILEDTLIGVRLPPWSRSIRRRLSTHPKFYFFDTGVTNAILKRLTGTLDTSQAGRLFEQWVILEVHRLLSYRRSEATLFYWRTNHGAEVDLLIERHGRIVAACEIKRTAHIAGPHLSGLRSFREENPKVPCFLVCSAPHAYKLDDVLVTPWQDFLGKKVLGFL